jgi:hypothetical protein
MYGPQITWTGKRSRAVDSIPACSQADERQSLHPKPAVTNFQAFTQLYVVEKGIGPEQPNASARRS